MIFINLWYLSQAKFKVLHTMNPRSKQTFLYKVLLGHKFKHGKWNPIHSTRLIIYYLELKGLVFIGIWNWPNPKAETTKRKRSIPSPTYKALVSAWTSSHFLENVNGPTWSAMGTHLSQHVHFLSFVCFEGKFTHLTFVLFESYVFLEYWFNFVGPT